MITKNMLSGVIESMNPPFDSHDVIRKAIHKFQKEYVAQLYAAIDHDFPFQYVHSAFGRDIAEICEKHGYVGTEADTPDLFGQSSTCTRWAKPA